MMTTVPMEKTEGELHLEALDIVKQEDATVNLKDQDKMMEGGPSTTKVPPKWAPKMSFPSDKSPNFANTGLLPEGGDATFTGGIVSCEMPAGACNVSAVVAGEGVSSGYRVSHEKFNADIKSQLMKEVRRYGRKYGKLFKILEEIQGPPERRIRYVDFTIKEAARFKRRHLIQCLEKKREELLSECSSVVVAYNK